METKSNRHYYDSRDCDSTNNDILLVCEHASDALPCAYSWSDNDYSNFSKSHLAYDIGAVEFARDLADGLKCLLIQSLYTHLFCDVNTSISSRRIFKTEADGKQVELNANLTSEEIETRLAYYYLPFHLSLREAEAKCNPKFIFSIKSFNPRTERGKESIEIGIMYQFNESFAFDVHDEFTKKGYNTALNEPFSALEGFNYVGNSMLSSRAPTLKKGVGLQIRNDLLLNESTRKKLLQDIQDIINNLSKHLKLSLIHI
eukprot:TRINITY_DN168_c0_g2_i6.p1 TRINITY_DN168_c0_g2~~TRINITY_DN168_c0_g2_i6.p1  ORF type:complete len:258 (+),score=31.34 TRINITY_DN168_c0_g2_i6:115-888(+)